MPPPEFFPEFIVLLEEFATFNSQLVLTGDLNIHLESPSLPATARFLDILSQFGLSQHVAEPTHTLGGWLDAVITRDDCLIPDLRVEPPSFSDHGLLLFTVPYLSSQPVCALRLSRGWKRLDRQAFCDGLRNSPLCGDLSLLADLSTDALFSLYETSMLPLIDSLLPLCQHRTYSRPLQPWLDYQCRSLRRNVRRLERRFRRTRDPVDRLNWMDHLRNMQREFRDRETTYWESLIEREKGNSRRLWAALSDVLGRSSTPRLPTSAFTAADYLNFVQSKIDATRQATVNASPPSFLPTTSTLSAWEPLQLDTIRQLVLDSSSKSCELDLLPSFLIKDFVDDFAPFLQLLCNSSLSQGSVPALHKRAVVPPLSGRD